MTKSIHGIHRKTIAAHRYKSWQQPGHQPGVKGLDHSALAGWAEQIAKLKEMGKAVVLFSAVAEGMQPPEMEKASSCGARIAGCRRGRTNGTGAGLSVMFSRPWTPCGSNTAHP